MTTLNVPNNTNINSLVTWPKNRLQAQQTLRDLKASLQTDAALHHAKRYLTNSTDDPGPEKTQKIIQQLCDAIDRVKEKIRHQSMKNLREETQFASMIDVGHHHNKPLSDLVSIPEERSTRSFKSDKTYVPYEIKHEHHYVQSGLPSETTESFDHFPFWYRFLINAMPYILTVFWGLLFLWGGAAIFHALDDAAKDKPYYIIMLYTLQVANTIGWGDTVASDTWSRIYTVFFTIVGVPIVFSAYANVGKLIDRTYCADWLFQTMVVRHKDPRNEKALKVPTVNSGYLLALHTLIVVIINNEWIQNIGVINSIYFSITSIATIGMGDYLPNPRNIFESIVCQFYIAAGIIILSAWYTSWSYHYQRLFFIVLRRYLHHGYKEMYLLRHHRKRFGSITFMPSRSSSMNGLEMHKMEDDKKHRDKNVICHEENHKNPTQTNGKMHKNGNHKREISRENGTNLSRDHHNLGDAKKNGHANEDRQENLV